MKSKRKLGLAFIILTMIIGVLIPNIDDKILAAGEIDYSSQVVVSDWDILDSSGVAISETNPASPENYYQLSGDWTLTINGATLKDGDYFKIALPKNEVSGSWSAVSSAWVDILADDNSTVLGQWRINSNNVEVQFNSNATGVYTVSGSFLTGSTSLKNSTFLGITQKVTFGGLEKTIAFTQAGSSLLSGNPGIVANHTSNNTIQWRIIMPSKSMNELTQNGKWGEEYTTDNQFLESKIEGEFNQLRISGIILNPNDLTNNDGRATAYSPFSVNVTSYFSEVAQYPLDTYDQFKAKIAPLNYGVYEDEYGERTVMINLGEVGNNGIRYSDIDNSFATKAANTLISNGYYDSSQQTVLEDYFTTTYGDGNVIGGNVATYRIFITETFPKVMSDSARLNSIIVSTNGTEKNLSATGTLQGLSGSGLSASAGTGRVYLSDVDNNAVLEGISFKLQIKQGDGSWSDYGGWSTGITNDEGYVETSTLGLGTYRFVQLDKLSNDYDLSSSNGATGGYDTVLGTCVSEEFVIDSGGTGKVVTMTNMKYKYTVTYKPGTQGDFADNVHGNIVINSSTPSFSGSKDSLTGNPLGKTGYTFNGWDKNIAIAVTENSEYVATWKANSYAINYYLDDGTNHASNPTTYTYGTGVLSFNNPSKDTYRFDGWYDDSDFTTANQITSIAATQTGTLNLYAKWVKQYTVTYDDNSATSGSVPTDIAKYESGQTIIAKGNTGDLKKTGHTFKGWTIKSDGSGTVYEENNLVPVSNSNITLYAKWEANKYDITYDLDGGTNDSGNPDKYTYGVGVTSFNKPSKTGYTFKGWYSEAAFTNEITNVSATQTGTVKLYAKWEVNKYDITYHLDGGVNDGGNPSKYTYGIGILSFEEPTKAGHTFKGWYSEATFINKVTSISTTNTGTVILYAKWEPNDYGITYELNGGDNHTTNPSKYTYGVGVSLFNKPTKTGHTFKGWYNEATFASEVTNISTVQTGAVKLYAKWEPNKYAISYNLNGGINDSSNPKEYMYGIGVLSFNNPTKAGYTFKGWYDTASFDNKITNISTTQLGTISLYAKWEVNEYAINYHLAGGVNDSNNPSTYTYGIGVTKLFEPTREGYTFKGWYTLPILGVEVKGISTTTLGTIDLYARWTPNTYAITYELDGGMNNSDNPNMYTYGVGVPTLKGATKEGYNFKGWYTAARTSSEVTNISDTQIGAITLYARWTPRTDVTYKVEHYQQQSDGTYLLVDINTSQGTTGEQVSAIAKVYQGYKLDNTVKGTLASGEVQADGSLVLKLYYNRNKSLSIITNPSTAPRPEGDGVGKPSMVNTADNTNIYNYVGLMMIALFWITISIKKRKENC